MQHVICHSHGWHTRHLQTMTNDNCHVSLLILLQSIIACSHGLQTTVNRKFKCNIHVIFSKGTGVNVVQNAMCHSHCFIFTKTINYKQWEMGKRTLIILIGPLTLIATCYLPFSCFANVSLTKQDELQMATCQLSDAFVIRHMKNGKCDVINMSDNTVLQPASCIFCKSYNRKRTCQ